VTRRFAVSICVLAIAHCERSPGREIQAFREAYDRIGVGYSDGSLDRAKSAGRAWDDVILALLNSRTSPDVIGQVLGSLPGNDGSTATGSGKRNPVAEWPDYESVYTLLPLNVGTSRVWVGVAEFGSWGDGAFGHLSVFREVGSRWQRIDALDAQTKFYAYPVGGLTHPTVALLKHMPAADGWTGKLEVLSVENGQLMRRGSRDDLSFYEVKRVGDHPRIVFSEYAKCLGMDVVGMHEYGKFELSVQAIAGAPVNDIRTASPWVAAVEEACAAVRAGHTPAIDDSRAIAAAVRVLRREHVMLSHVDGDPATGVASVVVSFDQETFTRFEVRRGPGDAWRIVSVTKGERDDDAGGDVSHS
jgi:hypothetical protein